MDNDIANGLLGFGNSSDKFNVSTTIKDESKNATKDNNKNEGKND